jgi:hypothetical protein
MRAALERYLQPASLRHGPSQASANKGMARHGPGRGALVVGSEEFGGAASPRPRPLARAPPPPALSHYAPARVPAPAAVVGVSG